MEKKAKSVASEGWYFRVLKEGYVEEGQTFTLIDSPYPQWTIERCNQIIHAKLQNYELLRDLSQCELLALGLRSTLETRLEKRITPDIRNRVFGPNE